MVNGRKIAMAMVSLQIIYLFTVSPTFSNAVKDLVHKPRNEATYREFFSEELFAQIKDYIGENPATYRVASIGLQPSVALYNGFYTLDAYMVNYPLEYKHQFRQIIIEELKKNAMLQDYFDYWGNRCYFFVDELSARAPNINNNIKIHHLSMNTEVFKQQGGRYIISAVEITNASDNKLKLVNQFSNAHSWYRIFLYEVTSD